MFFYLEDFESNRITGTSYEHIKSHRLLINEKFWATDLKGIAYECLILEQNRKQNWIHFKVLSKQTQASNLKMVLFQAIPEKLYLEKLVEIATLSGFKKINLFKSDFSPTQTLNLSRLRKISLQATLLSERTEICEISTIEKNEVWDLNHAESIVLQKSDSKTTVPKNIRNVVVGPEGGWSKAEQELFKNLQIQKLSLGLDVVYPAWMAGSVFRLGQA
jgi:RsmE family RNA methyltransferase